jgi:PAS domain S-box-containing protein
VWFRKMKPPRNRRRRHKDKFMGDKPTSGTGGELPVVLDLYRDINEALMIGSVRQHELVEIAERAEEALRTSEQRFRALVMAGSDVVYRMSPDWDEMLQLDGQKFMVDTKKSRTSWLQEYVHPDDQIQVMTIINEAVRTKSKFELEHRVLRVDGTLGWTFSRAIPLLDAKGEILEWFGAASDVTERKLSQEALKLFRALIDRSNDSIEVIDPQTGHFLDVNEKACTDLGYSREEFLSLKVTDINPTASEASFFELMHQLRDSISMVGNGVHRRKDGFTFPVEVSMKYVHLDRDYVVTVARDISERITAEEELRNSAQQLRALAGRLHTAREDESLRLARAIHDDLGHALTRLNMEVVFLEESLAKNASPRAEIFQRTRAMSKLVEETVHAVQRIATELRPGLLDDLGLAAALEWQAEEFAKRTGIRCAWKQEATDAELPNKQTIVVFRIFQEILNNITRHAEATTVDLSCTVKGGTLTLSIHDNGKGFDEATLSPHESLGLLGMRERALLIGGEIEIASAPGRGTTVSVITPVQITSVELPKPAKAARGRKT